MSTLLFVEILRERNVQAQWFDVRKIMRTSDRFGRAEPDVEALAELTNQQLAPRLADGIVITQGFIGSEAKAAPPRLAVAAATIPPRCWAKPACYARRYLD
jgi:aspartate kinase